MFKIHDLLEDHSNKLVGLIAYKFIIDKPESDDNNEEVFD